MPCEFPDQAGRNLYDVAEYRLLHGCPLYCASPNDQIYDINKKLRYAQKNEESYRVNVLK
jgi:hypothetical protein